MVDFYMIPKGESSCRKCSIKEFELLMQIDYQPTLCFESEKVHQNILKMCSMPKLESILSMRQKWLGFFYKKEIMSGEVDSRLILSWINPSIGYGVFARKNIEAQQFIGCYTGQIRRYHFFKKNTNNYCFDYSAGSFKTSFLIDAEKQGGWVRFINHADEPNLETIPVITGGILHMILCTTTPIPQGAQLTYDYGEDYWAKKNDPSAIKYSLNSNQLI